MLATSSSLQTLDKLSREGFTWAHMDTHGAERLKA